MVIHKIENGIVVDINGVPVDQAPVVAQAPKEEIKLDEPAADVEVEEEK